MPQSLAVASFEPSAKTWRPKTVFRNKSEVRIAYVLNVEDLKRAVEVLRVALTKYRSLSS